MFERGRIVLNGLLECCNALVMRCFLLMALVLFGGLCYAEETKKKSIYAVNKEALERTAKIYIGYEARHEVGPGVGADLKLPAAVKFRYREGAPVDEWIYPVALGLEIKIEGKRVIVMAPRSCYGWYLVATDDLQIKSYRGSDIQPIFDALEKRRLKLAKSPLD